MPKKTLLDAIEVKSPCNESWDEMIGNDEVRFCSHCAKNVHDISAMKRAEAENLVRKSAGKLCVRYVKTPTGKLITAPSKLTRIKHRATIAASVLATSLTISTLAYAQGEPIVSKKTSTQTQPDKTNKAETKQGLSIITGTIKDASDAVIQNAKITLRDSQTNEIRVTKSNDDGVYTFLDVNEGIYDIEVENPGFKKSVFKNVEIVKDVRLERSLVLEVSEATMGVVGIAPESLETTETKPVESIPQRQLSELPINDRKFVTMGLLPGYCPEEKLEKEVPTKRKKKKN